MLHVFNRAILLVIVVGLGGCGIPMPFKKDLWDTGSYSGRVLDNLTNEPIGGAQVEIAGFPESAVVTGEDGKYKLSPIVKRDNFDLWLFPGHGQCEDYLLVRHPIYKEAKQKVFSLVMASGGRCQKVSRDIDIRLSKQ